MDLAGTRVLVTGASKGIGELAARAFAAKGARVAVAARSGDKLEPLANELNGDAYVVDLADPAQVENFIDRVEADGAIDVLVNNAGLEDFTPIELLTSATIDQLISLNLATPRNQHRAHDRAPWWRRHRDGSSSNNGGDNGAAHETIPLRWPVETDRSTEGGERHR